MALINNNGMNTIVKIEEEENYNTVEHIKVATDSKSMKIPPHNGNSS